MQELTDYERDILRGVAAVNWLCSETSPGECSLRAALEMSYQENATDLVDRIQEMGFIRVLDEGAGAEITKEGREYLQATEDLPLGENDTDEFGALMSIGQKWLPREIADREPDSVGLDEIDEFGTEPFKAAIKGLVNRRLVQLTPDQRVKLTLAGKAGIEVMRHLI